MIILFIAFAIGALLGALILVGAKNPVHSALGLVATLISTSALYALLHAPFLAMVQVAIYAGAIMVLFVFAVMVLALGREGERQESQWLRPRMWLGPAALAAVLLGELIYVLASGAAAVAGGTPVVVGPQEVGAALFGPYALGAELSSMLLLAGMVAAYHLARRKQMDEKEGER